MPGEYMQQHVCDEYEEAEVYAVLSVGAAATAGGGGGGEAWRRLRTRKTWCIYGETVKGRCWCRLSLFVPNQGLCEV